MKLPDGLCENEVLSTIESVVNHLAPQFTFGYYDVDDIKQQGTLYALEAIAEGKFDSSRGTLRGFLSTHIKNRLKNLKRDKYTRYTPPCECCAQHPCEVKCTKYIKWEAANATKRGLMDAGEIVGDAATMDHKGDSLITSEIIDIVNRSLPVRFRSDYRRFVEGVRLPMRRQAKLLSVIRDILEGRI